MQTTKFLEYNKMLPKGQHGFRAKHSTMTAHEHMQKEWTNNTEEGLLTGILIWDLLAAFDIIDIDLLLKKLALPALLMPCTVFIWLVLTVSFRIIA